MARAKGSESPRGSNAGRAPRLGVLQAHQSRARESLGAPPPPLVVESQRYEEWMKIATDNKITSTNTWNLALIDYFHDMSLLRNGDGDNSINFQKASCTLDGCVKIWTSRVDSVATETGKLLSGLGDEVATQNDDDDDDDNDDPEADGEGSSNKRTKKRTARATATLADDFAKIRVKQFDLEFTVDPLFKKTSADFDEGGASGILMNHLGCDGNMKVVFDAGDAKLECDDDEDDAVEPEDEDEEGIDVDISNLREKCIPQGLISLESMHLTPSLSSFKFSADPNSSLVLDLLDFGSHSPADDNDDLGGPHPHDDADQSFGGFEPNDFGGGIDDDAQGGERLPQFDPTGEVDFFADQFSPPPSLPTTTGGGIGYGQVESFDPRRTGDRDLVVAMSNGTETGAGGPTDDADSAGLFDYFDHRMGKKNWAGPQHWKMKRNLKKVEDNVDPSAPSTKKPRKEKVPFTLDFSQDPPLSKEEIFQPATTKASILLPQSKRQHKEQDVEDYTLPEDHKFTSNVLLRLFLKPKTTLRMRRRGPVAKTFGDSTDPNSDDVAFWAQTSSTLPQGAHGTTLPPGVGQHEGIGILPLGPDGEVDYGGYDGAGDFDGGGEDDFPPPFDTQWLQAGEDGDEEEEADPVSEAEQDLAALTLGQLRRVKPEQVNYAKRAKRIDVKKLKDTMWRELEEVALPVKKFPTSLVYEPRAPPEELVLSSDEDDEAEPQDAASVRRPTKKEALLPVVSSLRRLYPKDKMSEISTSYMFICLLHLANEKGLRIQTPKNELEAGEDEGSAVRKSVGGLEALRVLKEVGSH